MIDAMGHDGVADRGARDAPAFERCRQVVRFGQLQAAMQRRPAHDLGVDVVARRVADLPDAVIRLSPLRDRALDDPRQEGPVVRIRYVAALAPAPAQFEQQAVHIALELLLDRVADAYRARAAPALEVTERDLGHPALAVDGVDRLQRFGAAGSAALHEAPEPVGLADAAEVR